MSDELLTKTFRIASILLPGGGQLPPLKVVATIIKCYKFVSSDQPPQNEEACTTTNGEECITPPPPPPTPVKQPPPPPPPSPVKQPPPPPPSERDIAKRSRHPFKSDSWFVAAGGPGTMKSRDALLKKINDDITNWREVVSLAPSNGEKRNACLHIRAWAAFTSELTEQDAVDAYEIIGKILTAVKTGKERFNSTTDSEYHEKFEKIEKHRAFLKTQSISSISPFCLFGGILPPRRTMDIEHFFIVLNEEDLGENQNGYAKNTKTLIFKKYKTSKTYGEQKYNLSSPSCMPFVDEEDISKAVEYLEMCKIGPLCGSSNYSTYFNRHNAGVSTNDHRHYWSSKRRQSSSRESYLALCNWLTHSPTTDIIHYSI